MGIKMSGFHHGLLHSNASLTSMIQRMGDLSVILFSLKFACIVNGIQFTISEWSMALTSIIIFQMMGGMTDFYRSWRGVKFSRELKMIFQNWTLSLILTLGIIAILNVSNNGLSLGYYWYFSACFFLVMSRLAIRTLISYMRHKGYNTRNVAIMGCLPVGIHLAESLNNAHWTGFRVLGYYDDPKFSCDVKTIPYQGNITKLIEDAKTGKIDRIYIAMSMDREDIIKNAISELSDSTCSVLLIPDIFTFNIIQSKSEEINGVSVISIFDTPMRGINALIKRIEDIIFSTIILIFISPVLFIISLMIKLTSTGPVIFKQKRYGLDGKAIAVWKFRTMSVMENGETVTQVRKGDSRLTSIGGFLRKTSLDELPQFLNVLKGDMSIVGPRPHAVVHNEQYRHLIKGYMLRHTMKPGITGWAQINGWRGETDTLDKMEKRIEYDLEYIRTWSVWLDFKIIILTVFKGFVNKHAY
ncbi:Putative colanic biosynthesis UDP-glucose lipid carrier transferase [Serratia fonticola]|nr:Putative colanic biosynthesis UDP-glucose lipid carrier transferase [Serratia fonticola]